MSQNQLVQQTLTKATTEATVKRIEKMADEFMEQLVELKARQANVIDQITQSTKR
ncbi:MAG: hypothetical protein HY565_05730 [Candidatus Kerfeldbacteria bacterium]|nr:hypothetical protein [Candidatus Kerfeldbacteria bacterium]